MTTPIPDPWCVSWDADNQCFDVSEAPPDDLGECEVIATLYCNRPSQQGGVAETHAHWCAAAPVMLAALRNAVHALNTIRNHRVGDTDSYSIASMCDKAIAIAEGRIA